MGGTLTAGEINILVKARDDASRTLGRIGNAAGKMGQVIRRGVMVGGLALAGLGVAAAATFISFDSAMTKSTAIMGDLDDAMRKTMEVTARDVAKTTLFSMTEAADSYFYLASAGLSAEQSIGALPLVAAFAQAGMFDMALATDLLTDAQSALGLTVDDTAENMENMARVSDVLVKANTLANATVEQFSTALTREAGAALKSFKIDVEEGVAVLAAFADQGVKGELAGTGLSRILRIMTSAAVSNADAYARLGVEVFDASGNITNLADIIADLEGSLGGMTDEMRVTALEALGFTARIQGVILPLLGTSGAIREYEGALREAAGTTANIAEKQLESLGAQLSLLRSGFEDVLYTVGKEMEPGLRALVATLREDVIPAIEIRLPQALDKARQLFDDWRPVIEDTAGAFRTFAEFIVTNKVPLIAALTAIGVAMALAFPHLTIAAAVVAIIGTIKLLQADLDSLGLSALKTRLNVQKFEMSILSVLDTGQRWAKWLAFMPGPIGLLGKAAWAAEQTVLDMGDAVEDLEGDMDDTRVSILEHKLGVDDLTTAQERARLMTQLYGNDFSRLADRVSEASRTIYGAGGLFGVLSWTAATTPSPTQPPPPVSPPSVYEEAGAAAGEAFVEGFEQAFLDRPAVSPEELTRYLQFFEAIDYMTIGDQIAYVEAAAAAAARELEETAQAAREMWESLAVGGDAFTRSMAIIAEQSGVTVRALELRLGLVDNWDDLGYAIRIVAGALGMTEAEVLALVDSMDDLAEEEEAVAEVTDRATQSLREQLSTVQNAIGAVSELAGVSRDDLLSVLQDLGIITIPTLEEAIIALAQELELSIYQVIDLAIELDKVATTVQRVVLPAVDDLVGSIASYFGLARDAVEEYLQIFPAVADAMEEAAYDTEMAIQYMLKQIGLTQEEIDQFFEDMEDAANDVADAVSGIGGAWQEIRRLIMRGELPPAAIEGLFPPAYLGPLPPEGIPPYGVGGEPYDPTVPRPLPELSAARPAQSFYIDHLTIQGDPREGLAALGVSV